MAKQGERLTKHKGFSEKILSLSLFINRNDEVDSAADGF